MSKSPFLVVWTLAVAAAACAFTVFLALRMRSIELGYDIGRSHSHLARLREVKRVLELERASYETPERVDRVARAVLGMGRPSSDRILPAGPRPAVGEGVAPPSMEGVPKPLAGAGAGTGPAAASGSRLP